MQPLQRSAARSARQLRPQITRQSRRHASEHGQGHSEPKNESLGAGFFIAVAALPASIAIFKYTTQEDSPYFTRLITETYDDYKTKWAQRNDLHTRMIEQAASDRVLFLSESEKPQPHLRFPEQFNTGSPWNVPAGHGSSDIGQVIAKYEKEAFEEQEKRLQQVRDNAVPSEQPVEALVKKAPSPSN